MLRSWNAAARLPWRRPIGFGLFSSSASPIAIDFGVSSVKVLQLSAADKPGSAPGVIAAAELPIPAEARHSLDSLMMYYASELPLLLRCGSFKGKRVICTIPASNTMAQHIQIIPTEGVSRDELINAQLQMQVGITPGSVVVRSFDVRDIHREGQNRSEVLCFTIPRDVVMRYVQLLEQCRLDVQSIHTPTIATIRAFDHIHRREGDEKITTMYIDFGYGGTRVAITHGRQLMFARAMQVGGMQFDQLIAAQRSCSTEEAMAYRLSMAEKWSQAGTASAAARPASTAKPDAPSNPESKRGDEEDAEITGGFARLEAAMAKETAAQAQPSTSSASARSATSAAVEDDRRRSENQPTALRHGVVDGAEKPAEPPDLTELLDTVTDELSMCMRYHRGLFPQRSIDRVVLLGGEARQRWLCQHVVRSLRLPTRLGDPIARLMDADGAIDTPVIDRRSPQPGWAAACGLCAIQTND